MRITLNNKNVVFVRKDKTLFQNKYKVVKEHDESGYIYLDNNKGVSILPYRFDKQANIEVMLRDEHNPLHRTLITIVSGGKEDYETGSNWWRQTARRELLEEAGIDAPENSFFLLDNVIVGKDHKKKDCFVCVDVSGIKQFKPETDGSIWEKKSTNFWVSIDLLKRMLKEASGNYDSSLMAIVAQFLIKMGFLDKSEEADLLKSTEPEKKTGTKRGPSAQKGKQKPVHKYIRREGQPGEYRYIYTEPEGKKGEKDDGKPKGIMAQLVEALGRKQPGGEKEKKAPKIKPLEEYARVKESVPDFQKGVTAEQWLGSLDANVINTSIDISNTYKANTNLGKVKNLLERTYIFTMKENPEAYPSSYTEINVEDKKLQDRAKILVQKAILKASQAYSVLEFHNVVMNSSAAENVFSELEDKFAAIDAEENTLKDSYRSIINGVSSPVHSILNTLNIADNLMREIKPLAKNDPKIDFMIDQIYESVDSLMKTRDRYIEDAVVFFINQIEPRLNNISDWYSFKSVMNLIDGFQSFNEMIINNSTISAVNLSFANQWNLKQKGIYDGASKYITNSVGRVVDTFRDVEQIQGSGVLDDIGVDFIEKDVFNFMSLISDRKRRFAINEQAFSYVDHFGLDRYYKDIVYISGIYDRVRDIVPSRVREVGILERITHAYEASNDSYNKMLDASNLYSKHNRFKTSADGIANTITLLSPKTNDFSKIDSFIALWSNASHGSLMTNAIEEMVNSKGIDRETYVNYHLASNRTIMSKRPEVKEELAKAIDIVYNNTQKNIKKDYDDNITLFRGNGTHETKSVASSWTWKEEEAVRFGDHVTEASVPHQAVLVFASSYDHGDAWEFFDEGEFVVVPGLMPPSQKIKTRPFDATDISRIQKEQDKKMDEMADAMDYADTHGLGETY